MLENESGLLTKLWAQTHHFILTIFLPMVYALLGRAAFWAHHKKTPQLLDVIRESFIVIFMGAVMGGLSEILAITSPMAMGAFVAAGAFYGPKIITIIVEYTMEKRGVNSKIVSDVCNIDLDEKDKKK